MALFFCHNQLSAQDKGAWSALYEEGNSKEIPYRLMKPANFNPEKKYPVILSLHGAGGRGTNNKKQLKDWNKQLADDKIRKEFPCYVLAPQSPSLWNKDQLPIIQKIIEKLPSVDMSRIYILGHSMGGHGTFILIQLAPGYFAAAAPSAGAGLKRTEKFINTELIKDIPIWTFHGDKDKTCPYDKIQKVFNEVKGLGGNMKLTTWHGAGHGVSGKFIPGDKDSTTSVSSKKCDPETNFLKWLFKEKNK